MDPIENWKCQHSGEEEEERHCVSGVPLNGRCKSGAHKCTGAAERAGQVSQVEREEGWRQPTSPLMNRLSKGEEREELDSFSGWLSGQLTRERERGKR